MKTHLKVIHEAGLLRVCGKTAKGSIKRVVTEEALKLMEADKAAGKIAEFPRDMIGIDLTVSERLLTAISFRQAKGITNPKTGIGSIYDLAPPEYRFLFRVAKIAEQWDIDRKSVRTAAAGLVAKGICMDDQETDSGPEWVCIAPVNLNDDLFSLRFRVDVDAEVKPKSDVGNFSLPPRNSFNLSRNSFHADRNSFTRTKGHLTLGNITERQINTKVLPIASSSSPPPKASQEVQIKENSEAVIKLDSQPSVAHRIAESITKDMPCASTTATAGAERSNY